MINKKIKYLKKGCGECFGKNGFHENLFCGKKDFGLCPVCAIQLQLYEECKKDFENKIKKLKEGIEKIKENGIINPLILRGLIDKIMGEEK